MFDRIDQGMYWDKAWTLVSGCTPCSPGCTHCWALAMERRFRFRGYEGCGARLHDTAIQIHPERLDIPLRRKKPTVYALWNDLFHEDVPYSFIFKVFESICSCRGRHTFLILTKRSKRMAEFMKLAYEYCPTWFSPTGQLDLWQTWLGVTVCNPDELWKMDELHKISAAVHWVSFEPLIADLGKLNLDDIEGVVLGGETGPGARPMKIEWARDVVMQCKAAGVPVFVKQLHLPIWKNGKSGFRLSKDPDEWPEEMQVRDLPYDTR